MGMNRFVRVVALVEGSSAASAEGEKSPERPAEIPLMVFLLVARDQCLVRQVVLVEIPDP